MESIEKDIERFLTVNPGSGDGSGDGDGDGYGYGYGYGDGDGDGDGDGEWCSINGRRIYSIDETPTVIYSVKGQIAWGAIVRKDLTLEDCYIARVGNSFAHGKTARQALEDATAKDMKDRPLNERIAMFIEAHPDLDTPYGDLFQWHNTLTGSCRMGRENWCREHGLKPTDSITVRQFIEGTKDNYGGASIRQLAKAYNIEIN